MKPAFKFRYFFTFGMILVLLGLLLPVFSVPQLGKLNGFETGKVFASFGRSSALVVIILVFTAAICGTVFSLLIKTCVPDIITTAAVIAGLIYVLSCFGPDQNTVASLFGPAPLWMTVFSLRLTRPGFFVAAVGTLFSLFGIIMAFIKKEYAK